MAHVVYNLMTSGGHSMTSIPNSDYVRMLICQLCRPRDYLFRRDPDEPPVHRSAVGTDPDHHVQLLHISAVFRQLGPRARVFCADGFLIVYFPYGIFYSMLQAVIYIFYFLFIYFFKIWKSKRIATVDSLQLLRVL
jgi:hypothetical protein